MQHLIFKKEPRRGEHFNLPGHTWEVERVMHHGGTQKYTLHCRSVFTQGEFVRAFSAEVREAAPIETR